MITKTHNVSVCHTSTHGPAHSTLNHACMLHTDHILALTVSQDVTSCMQEIKEKIISFIPLFVPLSYPSVSFVSFPLSNCTSSLHFNFSISLFALAGEVPFSPRIWPPTPVKGQSLKAEQHLLFPQGLRAAVIHYCHYFLFSLCLLALFAFLFD